MKAREFRLCAGDCGDPDYILPELNRGEKFSVVEKSAYLEACELISELEKRVSELVDHSDVVLENDILDWSDRAMDRIKEWRKGEQSDG